MPNSIVWVRSSYASGNQPVGSGSYYILETFVGEDQGAFLQRATILGTPTITRSRIYVNGGWQGWG